MKVGTLGNVVFEVSDTRVFTPSQVTRERKARIEEHQVQGALPCVEFIAPELGTFSISMTLSAALGVNPMREADSLGAMCKRGEVNRLILGGLNWGKVIIESVTQDWRNSGPHHRPDAGPEGVPLMPVVDMREAVPLVIGATGLDAVVQNIRMILTTFAYSVPLDRRFASHGGAIDAPAPVMAALRIAELTDAIEEKEPRAEVVSIRLLRAETLDGQLRPVVTFKLREGVAL